MGRERMADWVSTLIEGACIEKVNPCLRRGQRLVMGSDSGDQENGRKNRIHTL